MFGGLQTLEGHTVNATPVSNRNKTNSQRTVISVEASQVGTIPPTATDLSSRENTLDSKATSEPQGKTGDCIDVSSARPQGDDENIVQAVAGILVPEPRLDELSETIKDMKRELEASRRAQEDTRRENEYLRHLLAKHPDTRDLIAPAMLKNMTVQNEKLESENEQLVQYLKGMNVAAGGAQFETLENVSAAAKSDAADGTAISAEVGSRHIDADNVVHIVENYSSSHNSSSNTSPPYVHPGAGGTRQNIQVSPNPNSVPVHDTTGGANIPGVEAAQGVENVTSNTVSPSNTSVFTNDESLSSTAVDIKRRYGTTDVFPFDKIDNKREPKTQTHSTQLRVELLRFENVPRFQFISTSLLAEIYALVTDKDLRKMSGDATDGKGAHDDIYPLRDKLVKLIDRFNVFDEEFRHQQPNEQQLGPTFCKLYSELVAILDEFYKLSLKIGFSVANTEAPEGAGANADAASQSMSESRLVT